MWKCVCWLEANEVWELGDVAERIPQALSRPFWLLPLGPLCFCPGATESRGPGCARVQFSVCLSCSFRAEPVSWSKEFHDLLIGVKAALRLQQKSRRSQETGTWISTVRAISVTAVAKKGNAKCSKMSLLQLLFSHGKQPSAATKWGANYIPSCFGIQNQAEISSCSKNGSFLLESSLASVPAKDKLLLFWFGWNYF